MDAVLIPAISSVTSGAEMQALAEHLPELRSTVFEWPLRPADMRDHLEHTLDQLPRPLVGIAAGHAATLLARLAPGRLDRLVLIAPTWRGPFPTLFGPGRERLLRRIRFLLDWPPTGVPLARLNASAPFIARMMREHVYANPGLVTPELVRSKQAVARRNRHVTAAFITGALDPASTREDFLAIFAIPGLPPTVMLRPAGVPPRSAAEMDALAATGRVTTVPVPGALLAHEEEPEAVAAAIRAFLSPP